jgi:hypothetical protein
MNAVRPLLLLAFALVAAPVAFAASTASDIPPVPKLDDVQKLAERLVHSKEGMPLPPAAEIKDPFNAPMPADLGPVATAPGADPGAPLPRASNPDPVAPPRPSGDFETLEAVGSALTPSFVVVGGERILIFGQSRKKAGDTLLVTYKDVPLEIAITAIAADGTFTLRLRAAEYQRPVKLTKSTKPSP